MPPPREPRDSANPSEGIVEVPVHVVATSPMTLVVFDDGDDPTFTLDEMNSRSYDRLKLCRATTSQDPMLPVMGRMGAVVAYTGAILFPRMKGLSKEDVISSTNRTLLKATFGGLRFNAVAPDDVGLGYLYGSGYYITVGGANGANYQSLLALQHMDANSTDSINLLEARVRKLSEVHAAIRLGTPIVDAVPEMNPSLFLNGLTFFRQEQLAPALVFLWSTCESLIGRLWDDHALGESSHISGRRDFLNSNSWQAAHKVEVLYQMNIIRAHLYEKLSLARKARNALAHRGSTPTLDSCKLALQSAFQLVAAVRSSGKDFDEFSQLADDMAGTHDGKTRRGQPKYWREIPSVPGDEKWKGDYPRHPEIELVPISDLSEKGKGQQ